MMSGFSATINIPTYNQEAVIQRAIESALMQNGERLTINVLDDASTDDTFKMARLIEAKNIKLYRNEKNLGRVKTYHKLLFELTNSDWVVNLDGDDYFSSPDFITEAKKWIEQFPREQIAFFQANHLNLPAVARLKTALKLDHQTYIVDGIDYLKNYHRVKSFDHFATLYNREFAINAAFYSFDSMNTDFNSVMKLCLHGKVILSALKVGVWNYNSQSETNRIFEKKNLDSYFAAIEDLVIYSEKKLSFNEVRKLRRNLLHLIKNYLFMIAIKKGDLKTAGSLLADNVNFSFDYIRSSLKFLRISMQSIFKPKE